MNNSVIPQYYDTYQAILGDTRFVKAYFYLSPADIANLDFTVPVWVEHFGAYWYINQVVQWEAGRSCEVELVKL
jgi:hypothetical protein